MQRRIGINAAGVGDDYLDAAEADPDDQDLYCTVLCRSIDIGASMFPG